MRQIMYTDGNSVGYAAQGSGTKLMAGNVETTAIFGVINSIRAALTAFPSSAPYILWDGHAQFRYDIFPGYKDRSGKDEKIDDLRKRWKAQRPLVQDALEFLGVRQLMHPDLEADDLAGQFTDAQIRLGNTVLLYTGDKDWLQLLQPGVAWHDHRSGEHVALQGFFDKTGYETPKAFVEAKALTGDASDTIPGVGGIGEKTAQALIAEYKSVAAFRQAAVEKNLKLPKTLARLVEDQPFEYRKKQYPAPSESFKRNIRLMDLRRAPEVTTERLEVRVPAAVSVDKFQMFCEEHGFQSILNDLPNFLVPFHRISENYNG